MKQQWLSLIENKESIDSKRTILAVEIGRAGVYKSLLARRCI